MNPQLMAMLQASQGGGMPMPGMGGPPMNPGQMQMMAGRAPMPGMGMPQGMPQGGPMGGAQRQPMPGMMPPGGMPQGGMPQMPMAGMQGMGGMGGGMRPPGPNMQGMGQNMRPPPPRMGQGAKPDINSLMSSIFGGGGQGQPAPQPRRFFDAGGNPIGQ